MTRDEATALAESRGHHLSLIEETAYTVNACTSCGARLVFGPTSVWGLAMEVDCTKAKAA